MRSPAVNWSEGMFLRPHHFQAADRYWSETIAHQISFASPYGYGIQRVSVSTDALVNGVLEFSGLRARWSDGTLIAQDEVVRVPLGERFASADVGNQGVVAYLALPTLREGQGNVSQNGSPGGLYRYVEFSQQSDDETAGGNRQSVSLRKLNCQVKFSHEELAGFDLIPLVRLKRSDTQEGKLLVDPRYFPPSITVQSWPELASVCRQIYDAIGSRKQSLADTVRSKGITLSSQTQGDLEKIMLLHALNEAYGQLTCLAFAEGVHPLIAYTSLCRIIGQCSLFGPSSTIEEVPKYDHEDLATIFYWSLEKIKSLIYAVKEDAFVQRYFYGVGRGMAVKLEPEWFGSEWDWYFGVDPVTLSRDECKTLLRSQLDWRLGSSEKVEDYFVKRMRGIELTRADTPPALPRNRWLYFQIRREGDAWDRVQESQTMAMRIKTEQIDNLGALESSQRIRIKTDNKICSLEFAIFAVKKRI